LYILYIEPRTATPQGQSDCDKTDPDSFPKSDDEGSACNPGQKRNLLSNLNLDRERHAVRMFSNSPGPAGKTQFSVTVIGLVSIVLATSGCFTYRPYSADQAKPNEELRLIVTEGAALRLKQQFGLTTPLEGRLSPLSADTFGLAVWVGRGFSGSDFATIRQTVPLVRSEIVEVHRKRLSVKRSAYFAAGIIAITSILVDRLGIIDIPGLGDSETPIPPEPDPFRFRRR
jgi:hypothetical protein